MRLLVSLWASDSAHHFVARMSAVTVELQWKISPHTASAATGVRADTPCHAAVNDVIQGTSLCQGPLLSWNNQASSGQMESMGAQFAMEIREDACVGRHMPRYVRTFACYCSLQRGGGCGSES